MIAALPMYDWPDIRPATDAFWAALAAALRARGIEAPERLERGRDAAGLWRDPDLLFAQTCGYPYARQLRGTVRLVAVPVHAAEGCAGATYRSALIVRREDPPASVEMLRGARVAYNSTGSQSGYSALRAAIAPHARDGRFFGEGIETGAHIASMEAVAGRSADCAAVDAVCWTLARRHRPHVADRLAVLAWTAPAPALPYVTAARRSDEEVVVIREALREVLADPAMAEAREALLLAGIEVVKDSVYDQILDMERAAAAAGYPEVR